MVNYLERNSHLSLALRLALISLFLNLATETSGVFLPLYARGVGASDFEIGLIASSYGLAFFISSFVFGRLSDMRGRVMFIRVGLGLVIFAYLSQVFTQSAILLLIARGAIGLCLGISSVVIMAYTYEAQRQIGRFASYGSLGWVAGGLISAVLRDYHSLFLVSVACSVLAFVVTLTLKEGPLERRAVSLLPMRIIRANRKVYVGFFLRQLGGNAIWAIFALYLSGIGASKTWIAALDVINNGSQFIAMSLIERFNNVKIFRLGLALSSAVFVIYAFANNYLQIIPVQIMLALAWSGMFIGALGYLLKKNPEHGTVSGVLYSSIYLSAGIGPFFGGAISQAWGFPAVMGFGGGVSFLGFLYSVGMKEEHEKKEL